MLFTIVKGESGESSFRGLLFIGDELMEGLKKTSEAMFFVCVESDESEELDHLVAHLEDSICFVQSEDEGVMGALVDKGFKFYRCLDMDNGGRPM